MGVHRKDLIHWLEHTLQQLDQGLDHFQKEKPSLGEDDILQMRRRYQQLKDVLFEVEREQELHGEPPRSDTLFSLLTLVGSHGIPLNIHVCNALHIATSLECLSPYLKISPLPSFGVFLECII